MSLPASQAAGRLLFLQLLDTMPIRAEDLCVNLPAGAATGRSASRTASASPSSTSSGRRCRLCWPWRLRRRPQDRHPLTTARGSRSRAPEPRPGPSASAESGSGVTLSLRMSLMAHQAAIRFPDQPHRSVARGRSVAQTIFDWSRVDGGHEGYLRNFPADYVPPAGPGLWVPTPPAFQPALQPFWGQNRCFAIASGSACPPAPPTAYSEDPSSAFFAEAREVYDAVNNRTPEQEAIALFWSDDPGVTATPPGHSISIATQVLRLERASLMTAADTYAKVGMAAADGFIACWHAKYRYNLLRPVSASSTSSAATSSARCQAQPPSRSQAPGPSARAGRISALVRAPVGRVPVDGPGPGSPPNANTP